MRYFSSRFYLVPGEDNEAKTVFMDCGMPDCPCSKCVTCLFSTISPASHRISGFYLGSLKRWDQIKTDGVAYPVTDNSKTAFSAVTFFRRERSLRLTGQMTYQELQQQIDEQLPTSNLPYAIRLQGTFPSLKVRSVPKQTPPYSPLNDVVSQQQIVFELQNVQGTLVGFRLPQYLKDVNVAGYHLHFITSDRKAGGHLLDGAFLNPVVDVNTLQDWQIMLPNNTAFEQASLK